MALAQFLLEESLVLGYERRSNECTFKGYTVVALHVEDLNRPQLCLRNSFPLVLYRH